MEVLVLPVQNRTALERLNQEKPERRDHPEGRGTRGGAKAKEPLAASVQRIRFATREHAKWRSGRRRPKIWRRASKNPPKTHPKHDSLGCHYRINDTVSGKSRKKTGLGGEATKDDCAATGGVQKLARNNDHRCVSVVTSHKRTPQPCTASRSRNRQGRIREGFFYEQDLAMNPSAAMKGPQKK